MASAHRKASHLATGLVRWSLALVFIDKNVVIRFLPDPGSADARFSFLRICQLLKVASVLNFE